MDDTLNQTLVLGVDAGGTRTRAVLAALEGPFEAPPAGTAGPGNALSVPPDRLAGHLTAALAAAVPEALRPWVRAVAGGFAGAARVPDDGPGRRAALTALRAACGRLGLAPAAVEVFSDVEAAFAGAPGTPAEGLALVSGTGAVAVRIAGRTATASADGNGWLLGDDGSGFWLGRQAVRAALRAADGRGPRTSLRERVADALLPGGGPAGAEEYRSLLVPAVMAAPPLRLAELAPLAVGAAQAGDEVAAALLDEAADLLTATLRALHPRPGELVVATGGLLVPGPGGPEVPDGALTTRLAARLAALGVRVHWAADGLPGAVALARLASRCTPGRAGPGRSARGPG